MSVRDFPIQNIPQRLIELDQWVGWKFAKANSGFTKVPISAKTGHQASTTKSCDWSSFDEALTQFQDDRVLAGIGFVFNPDDCFTGIDLDVCLDESGDFIWGNDIVDLLSTYTEISPSGRGVKLIVEGSKPPHVGCQRKGLGPDKSGQIEVYDHARFSTITGRRLSDAHAEIAAKQDELTAICRYFWAETSQQTSPSPDRSNDSPDEIQRRAIAYLDAMPPAISGIGGHSQTYAAATALVHGFGLEPGEALVILTRQYNPRCVPPWSDKELQHKISQAATKPHDRPFGWLRDEYTSQPINEVDLSQFKVHSSSDEEADDDPPIEPASSIEDPGPLPERLLRVPGFINEVMDHCLDTAPYPNPVMAFCGALALQAFLAGRRVRDPGDNRTNLYLLGLAHSAAGKDWPRKLNVRILQQIGVADQTGERFASGEGLQDALHLTPAMLFQTDEIDGLLQSISKSKDARYEQLMSTLLTMYSSANSVYPMRRKAGKEAAGVIDQPNLVILGTAIPNHYYAALSERMLTNGLFARMLIFECGKRGKGQEPKIRQVPESIIETATWWQEFQPGPAGNLPNRSPVPAISERIRDKVAASRRRGKWSGGMPLLGYTVENTKLIVDEIEATRVRQIFELYLEYQSLLPTIREINRRGWTTKRWITKKGDHRGGREFTRNALYKLLTNVTYVGKIKYKDEMHEGEHVGIVPVEQFNRVQNRLTNNGKAGGTTVRNKHNALLKGLLQCKACGRPMTHSYSSKGNKRYRYYVCGTAMQKGWSECPSPSVPAGEIERFVVEQIRTIGSDPVMLAHTAAEVQSRSQIAKELLRDERKALDRQIRNDHSKLQAIAANTQIAGNISGLSEIQQRIQTADQRLKKITDEEASLATQEINQSDIQRVLADFDEVWDALPPREQVRVVSFLVASVSFDGPGGNVAITFHATGLKSPTQQPLETAQ